jgi:serine/threonine-protein kinase
MTIYVSSGLRGKTVIMPKVIGMSERDARKALAAEEIAIARIDSEYSDEYAPGYIIDQSIMEFSRVLAKSTKVTLKMSIGPEPVEIGENEENEGE